jgi:hypothetical protein
MVPSESAPQELSNEWSCQYVSTILIFWAISVSRRRKKKCYHHGQRKPLRTGLKDDRL